MIEWLDVATSTADMIIWLAQAPAPVDAPPPVPDWVDGSGQPGQGVSPAGGIVVMLLSLLCVGASFLIGLAALAFWIWMIVDVATRKFESDNEKIVWVLVVIFTNWIGALIYFFAGRPRGQKD